MAEFYPIAIVRAEEICGYCYIKLNGDMYKIIEFDSEEPGTVTFTVMPASKDVQNPFKSTKVHGELRMMIYSLGKL